MENDEPIMIAVGQHLTKPAVEIPLGSLSIRALHEAISLQDEISATVIRPTGPVEHPELITVSSD